MNAAISETDIDHLCGLLGIASHYYDYKGERHEISRDARQRIIQALGFDPMPEQIHQLEVRPWLNRLPPVCVVREHWDKTVEITVPEKELPREAHWRLVCEHGQVLTAAFLPGEQHYLQERHFGGERYLRYRLYLPFDIPTGYHNLELTFSDKPEYRELCSYIVAPQRCYQQPELDQEKKLWGFGVQLYTLGSERNWGIGDYRDLQELVKNAAAVNASFVGLNPLHVLFPANAAHISPYSPSNRLFLNYLYIDIESVPEFIDSGSIRGYVAKAEFQTQLQRLRDLEHIDYPKVAELKMDVLRLCYRVFRLNELAKHSIRAQAFYEFVEEGGELLYKQAAYDVLHAEFLQGWRQWPEKYQDCNSTAVHDHVREQQTETEFYLYLQWIADGQLAAVQAAARNEGMVIGLYRDLAVGADTGGGEIWSNPDSYSFAAGLGAPPDPLALNGQDWGICPFNPHSLRQSGYQAFIRLIRANMRHSGALRIDHVMGLFRLWWVPKGSPSRDGAYVYYPLQDLLGILALESWRNRCMVIGEDLGTVPEEIQRELPTANVYSYKVLYFEKTWNNEFKHPDQYPSQAMATVTTHDLPPLFAWWSGDDLALRDRLDLFPSEDIRRQEYASRAHDREALLRLLAAQGGSDPDTIKSAVDADPWVLLQAVYGLLAECRSSLMVIHLEDLLLMHSPVNVPGTVDEYPNWRRKLTQNLEFIFEHPRIRDFLQRTVQGKRLR